MGASRMVVWLSCRRSSVSRGRDRLDVMEVGEGPEFADPASLEPAGAKRLRSIDLHVYAASSAGLALHDPNARGVAEVSGAGGGLPVVQPVPSPSERRAPGNAARSKGADDGQRAGSHAGIGTVAKLGNTVPSASGE